MRLTDHIDGVVLQQVAHSCQQKGGVIFKVTDPQVTGVAKQASDGLGGMAVVDVKPTLGSAIRSGASGVTDSAFPALDGKHGVVLIDRDAVAVLQIPGSLGALPSDSFGLDGGHVVNDRRSVVGLMVDAMGAISAARPMEQALFVVEHLAAVLTGLEYPCTGANLGFASGRDQWRLASVGSPLPSVEHAAIVASTSEATNAGSVFRKIAKRFKLLACRANSLTWKNCRGVGAAFRKVALQVLGPDVVVAVTAKDGRFHSSTFGIFASRMARRTAPERVVDHAAARRSSLAWTLLSTLTTKFLSFCVGFIMQYNTTKFAVGCQIQNKGDLAAVSC